MLARCTSSLDLHMLIVPLWYIFRTLLVTKLLWGTRCVRGPLMLEERGKGMKGVGAAGDERTTWRRATYVKYNYYI